MRSSTPMDEVGTQRTLSGANTATMNKRRCSRSARKHTSPMYTDTHSHAHFCSVLCLRRTCDALRTLKHIYGSRLRVNRHSIKSSDADLLCLCATDYNFHSHDLTLSTPCWFLVGTLGEFPLRKTSRCSFPQVPFSLEQFSIGYVLTSSVRPRAKCSQSSTDTKSNRIESLAVTESSKCTCNSRTQRSGSNGCTTITRGSA